MVKNAFQDFKALFIVGEGKKEVILYFQKHVLCLNFEESNIF